MTPNMEVPARDRAIARVRTLGDPATMLYLVYAPRSKEIVTILCKGCGAMIRGRVEDSTRDEWKEINGQRVLIRREVLMNLPLYAEVMMTFEDESKHVTQGCRTCLTKLAASQAPDELERWYVKDMAQMLEIERRGLGDAYWGPDGSWAARVPVSVALLADPSVPD